MTAGASSAAPPGAAPPPRMGPRWLELLSAGIDRLGVGGGVLAGLSLAALTLLILLEVAVRLLSNVIDGLPAGMPRAWEYSAYLMGIAFMAGAAFTLRAGAHIRVSILLAALQAGPRRLLEAFAALLGLLLTSFLAWSLVLFTWGSYVRGQTTISSDTPVWIPEAGISLGAVLLALQMFARFLQALFGARVELPHLRATASEQ